MRLLHLSDLHLGKRVFETSLLEEQQAMLDQALVMARQADATIIAGDIYDRPVPPAEAVALFDAFLTRMSAQGSPVLMISGNHDSAERIAFGSRLMGASGVHVSPVFDGDVRCVTLSDLYGAVHIHLLPFIKPAHVRAALGREDIEGYTTAMAAAIERMNIDPADRHVLVAHQFVTGASRSESEEVSVGGLDSVDADVFSPFDYVALGHLHTAQSLCGGRVRYCGSPLCYAFSEAGRPKCALLVELGKKGDLAVTPLFFTPVHAMRRLRGRFDDLIGAREGTQDYVQVILTDEQDVPDAASRLTAVYPNLMQVLYDNARTRAGQAEFEAGASLERSPLELFEELYSAQNGMPMTDAQRTLLKGMMETIWEDEG